MDDSDGDDFKISTSTTFADNVLSINQSSGIATFAFNPVFPVNSVSDEELDEGGTFTWTGTTHSFSGVTNFLIPAVANSASEIAIDTTNDDQFIYYGDAANVLTGFNEKCFSLENASTGDDDIMIWHPHRANSNYRCILYEFGWNNTVNYFRWNKCVRNN